MPIPSSINDLSTTAGSNSPAGSESPSLIDDYLRTYASYIALLRDAAQTNSFNIAAAGGSANAITATYSPAVTVLTDGMILYVKAASANTTAATFSPNGLTAKAIVGLTHLALIGGEIVANSEVCLQYNSSVGGGSWVLIYASGGTCPIKTIKRQVISASGTYTPSPGMVFCDVEVVGGGGGGGGAAGGAGTSAAAGGGGYGGYSKKMFTAAQIGASQTVTIGAAGTGGTAGNNAGGTGGNTTFGALLTGNGGVGGSGSAALTTAGVPAGGGAGGTATGGDLNIRGSNGFAGIVLGGSSGGLSGKGGGGVFGEGGYPSGPTGSGNGGNGNGSGGSGGATATAGNAAGASGSIGLVVVLECCTV